MFSLTHTALLRCAASKTLLADCVARYERALASLESSRIKLDVATGESSPSLSSLRA